MRLDLRRASESRFDRTSFASSRRDVCCLDRLPQLRVPSSVDPRLPTGDGPALPDPSTTLRSDRGAAFLAGDLVATLAAFLAAWLLRFEVEVIPVTKNVPDFGPLPPARCRSSSCSGRSSSTSTASTRAAAAAAGSTRCSPSRGACCSPPCCSRWSSPGTGRPRRPGSPEYFTYSRAFLGLFALADLVSWSAARMAVRARCCAASSSRAQPAAHPGGRRRRPRPRDHAASSSPTASSASRSWASSTTIRARPGRPVCGVPVLGTLRQAEEVLATQRIDQVFIALPLEAHRKILQLLEPMARECVEIKLVPDILQYATLKATLEDLDGTPVINLSQVPLQGWNSLVKRAMDLAIAARRAARRCCRSCRSSRSPSGSRTAARSSTARSAWGSTAARS